MVGKRRLWFSQSGVVRCWWRFCVVAANIWLCNARQVRSGHTTANLQIILFFDAQRQKPPPVYDLQPTETIIGKG
jgi:hypothetical protein